MESICGIYGIFDKSTDVCLYIGQSQDILKRWSAHRKLLLAGNHLSDFNDWVLEHWIDQLDFRILEKCENIALEKNTLEIKWFNHFCPCFYGKRPSLNEMPPKSSKKSSKKRQPIKIEMDKLLLLRSNGLSVTEIAKVFNVTPVTIYNHLSKDPSYESMSHSKKEAPYGRDISGNIKIKKQCPYCGKDIFVAKSKATFCSLSCGAKNQHYKARQAGVVKLG